MLNEKEIELSDNKHTKVSQKFCNSLVYTSLLDVYHVVKVEHSMEGICWD